MRIGTIPGLSLGIVQIGEDGKPRIELAAWGRGTEDAEEHDLTPEGLFGLASCSKAFLATSVGLLMDDFAEGRNVTPLPDGVTQFDWNTKVKDTLPGDWELADEWATEKANWQDLLSHVSGLPRHDYSYTPGDTPQDIARRMRYLPPPTSSDSNGPITIRCLYSAPTSSRHMQTCHMWTSSRRGSSCLSTWRRLPSGQARLRGRVVGLNAGPGGIISSAADMTKWIAVLLNAGVVPSTNRTIIPQWVFDEVTTAHAITNGQPPADLSIQGYGLGWGRWSYKGHEIVTHTGGIPGFSTLVAFLPTDRLGFVILANAGAKAHENDEIMYRIVDEVFGLPEKPQVVVTPVEATSGEMLSCLNRAPRDRRGLSLALDEYAGTYHDPGYGAFTLCAPNSTSHYCSGVLGDFAPFEHFDSSPAPVTLYVAWRRMWSTHARLVHRDGDAFGVTATALFPHGYGKNESAFETYEEGEAEGRAEFVFEEVKGVKKVKGLALMIDEHAVAARARQTRGTVEEIADAWFVKV
ncbi:hypothetical protein A0H81_05171 [Grifola frondosa]|uniref:Beta-lactamase-related domain-containing protein n=1 Tax=Grifola frondosa TaxID=5627 RepID=A0A1C7MEH3_GRIFR|nr:hypothetical protein A0H81_05171 [Grifola frondosa]